MSGDPVRAALLAFAKEAGSYARRCAMLRMEADWDEWLERPEVMARLQPAFDGPPSGGLPGGET